MAEAAEDLTQAQAGDWPDFREVLGHAATLLAAADGALPVGTILAYAGQFPNDYKTSGWYPCDGLGVSTTGDFAELFEAIGFAFGQSGRQEFRLPDLRGWFLRGTTAETAIRTTRDPDWENRCPAVSIKAPPAFASSAGAVGTVQPYGTAKPRTSFSTSVDHLNIKNWHDDKGKAQAPGSYENNSFSFSVTGGDLESRPVNKYVAHVIKVRSSASPPPVGTLVPFAGQVGDNAPPTSRWRVCHGDPVTTFDAPDLFDEVNFIHGQVSENEFVLPDYRGHFQRGVAGESPADPEAESRTWAYRQGSDGERGNRGNNVGSAQPWATGAPTRPFLTTVDHLPTTNASERIAGFLWNLLRKNDGAQAFDFSTHGGDSETRPTNVSVDWYVLSSALGTSEPSFPVGAVAAMGCTLETNEWWLPCDGHRLPVSGNEELYGAIGNTYGGDDTSFGLPDYQGRFLRGASHDSGVDPEADRRVAQADVAAGAVGTLQDWATGKPNAPFRGNIPHYPDSELGAHGATHGGNAGNDGSLTFNTCTSGGDPETRPRNVYVNFYIRAKAS